MGYKYDIPSVKPLLNRGQHQCLTWAKKKINWTTPKWSKVFFSDESNFCILFGNQEEERYRIQLA